MFMTDQRDLENLTFVLGGARSGKSTQAEKLAQSAGARVLYLATAEIRDAEMERRVAMHQSRRPAEWDTLNAPLQCAAALSAQLEKHSYDAVLLDCLSLLTSNVLLTLPEDSSEAAGWAAVQAELEPLIQLISEVPTLNWIVVSNEVGQGIVPAYPLGRLYRDVLGRANQYLAACAGSVLYMVAGLPMKLKG